MAPTRSSVFIRLNVDPLPPSCPRQCNQVLHFVLTHLTPWQSPADSKLGIFGHSQTRPGSPNHRMPDGDTSQVWDHPGSLTVPAPIRGLSVFLTQQNSAKGAESQHESQVTVTTGHFSRLTAEEDVGGRSHQHPGDADQRTDKAEDPSKHQQDQAEG